ncbi:MAG: hypothetical protein HY226_01570 [Candidatus Vogelbacteria bacterium]|nr:hypothetical protein [Candidatus Vogelbacteria bacterium]
MKAQISKQSIGDIIKRTVVESVQNVFSDPDINLILRPFVTKRLLAFKRKVRGGRRNLSSFS